MNPVNKYIIGVDGGNSKTDYYLFDLQGNYIDHLRTGTCSHERFPDAYASTFRIMLQHLEELLTPHDLEPNQLAAAAFGLAGADIPSQKEQLGDVIKRLGFSNYAVDNDSFLGIKAGSEKGYGICSINGSGMSTGGISRSGERLQVGGVGSELSGDEAGGFYLARKVLRTVYDSFYRMGEDSAMTKPVMDLLRVSDKSKFIEAMVEGTVKRNLPNTELMQILFTAADQGDAPAISVIDQTAEQLARSSAGCLNNLNFLGETEVDIVLAGSVWIKAESPLLFEKYKQYMARWVPCNCRYIFLQVPPAAGAVLWALELFHGQPVHLELRHRIISSIEQVQAEQRAPIES